MRPQRARPKPTKGAEKIILTAFSVRFVFGLLVFCTITVFAFQAEPHFGWIMVLITGAYLAVAGSILVKALRGYKQRYGEKK